MTLFEVMNPLNMIFGVQHRAPPEADIFRVDYSKVTGRSPV